MITTMSIDEVQGVHAVRLLLDTHALHWFIEGDPQLSPLALDTVGDPDNEVLVSLGDRGP